MFHGMNAINEFHFDRLYSKFPIIEASQLDEQIHCLDLKDRYCGKISKRTFSLQARAKSMFPNFLLLWKGQHFLRGFRLSKSHEKI